MDFSNKLNAYVTRVEAGIAQHVPAPTTRPARVHAAMRYSLEAGGKRVRPVLVLAAAEAARPTAAVVGNPATATAPLAPDPLAAAVAIECVHTYSLIHDDLPCMDDDDLRRGRPTLHRAFDEATAVLAGDALLTHAFGLLATAYAPQPELVAALVRVLADAAGSQRLIGGQMEDILAEDAPADAGGLEFIHLQKTAAMLEAALELGGRVGGATEEMLATLRHAGRQLGLAFQIIDDVLDATSDSATLGKTPGKDARAGKTTYVSLHGLDAARAHAARATDAALAGFAALPASPAREFLLALTAQLLGRAK